MQTLNQRYSASAYKHTQEVLKEKDYKEYGVMAHKLPILIRTAGLVQALEFVHSHGKPKQKYLLEHLAMTIGQNNADNLRRTVREADLSQYIYLTKLILAALTWYKRFALSILEVDVTETVSENSGEQ